MMDRRTPLGVSFLWGSALNFPWELAQMALYVPKAPTTWADHLFLCLPAALMDGVGIALIYGAGAVLFRRPDWVCRPEGRGWLLSLGLGLSFAVLTEWLALALGWWRYGPQMPVVPGVGVGLSPLLQFLFLPPLTLFVLVGRWLRRRSAAA